MWPLCIDVTVYRGLQGEEGLSLLQSSHGPVEGLWSPLEARQAEQM